MITRLHYPMLPVAKYHIYVLIFYAGIPIDRLFVLQTVNNLISNLETYGIVVKTGGSSTYNNLCPTIIESFFITLKRIRFD